MLVGKEEETWRILTGLIRIGTSKSSRSDY